MQMQITFDAEMFVARGSHVRISLLAQRTVRVAKLVLIGQKAAVVGVVGAPGAGFVRHGAMVVEDVRNDLDKRVDGFFCNDEVKMRED
jgi:hypothetical protein